MGRRTSSIAVLAVTGAIAVGVLAAMAAADGGSGSAQARMSSYFEVPSLSTTAQGRFEARIRNNNTIEYKLTYSGLEGVVTQAHIHFAQLSVNGGISAWLCETSGTQSPQASFATPCPQTAMGSTAVTGTITANEVLGPATQGIAPTQINELIAAMRAGFTYANVHTSTFPGGELRGQIGRGGGGGDDDD
jgi:hypothetical protein